MENKKLKNKKNRLLTGFTIVELIVVIAIIAVLAAIVLVNVTSYIAKGKNASIKANMATLLTNGTVWYDSNSSSYLNFDTNTATGCAGPILTAVNTSDGGALTCHVKNVTSDAWCGCSSLNTTNNDPAGSTYCVDSSGVKKETTTACATECTAAAGVCL